MKLCVMTGVREYAEGAPIELHYDAQRLIIAATNEAGDKVMIDLADLLNWLEADPTWRAELLSRLKNSQEAKPLG